MFAGRYWREIPQRYRLEAGKCKQCGKTFFPPRLICDQCKSREFDTIILSDVLEHLPEPESLWREMHRVLASEGKLLMNVPFYYWLHEQPHDYYRYTEFALRRFADVSGFELIHLDAIGGAPEIMADLFAKNIRRVPKLGSSLARLAQWLTARFIATRLGRRCSESSRQAFPLGYFLVAQKPPDHG